MSQGARCATGTGTEVGVVKHDDAFYLWLFESWRRPRWRLSAERRPDEQRDTIRVKGQSHLHHCFGIIKHFNVDKAGSEVKTPPHPLRWAAAPTKSRTKRFHFKEVFSIKLYFFFKLIYTSLIYLFQHHFSDGPSHGPSHGPRDGPTSFSLQSRWCEEAE